jgi:hypothetical protein
MAVVVGLKPAGVKDYFELVPRNESEIVHMDDLMNAVALERQLLEGRRGARTVLKLPEDALEIGVRTQCLDCHGLYSP